MNLLDSCAGCATVLGIGRDWPIKIAEHIAPVGRVEGVLWRPTVTHRLTRGFNNRVAEAVTGRHRASRGTRDMKPKPPKQRGGKAAFATVDGAAVDAITNTPASEDSCAFRLREIEKKWAELLRDFAALKREAQARHGEAATGGEFAVRPSGTVNHIYNCGMSADVCYVYHAANGEKSVTTKGGRAK